MYKQSVIFSCLFLHIMVCASDPTKKQNEEAALRRWLSGGKTEELTWAHDYFQDSFKRYGDTYQNAPLNDAKAIEDGQFLLTQLCDMPVQTAHAGLQSLRWELIHELEVRLEFAKKPEKRDYARLINMVVDTKNITAHNHIAQYLVNNPSKKTFSLVPLYFEKLSKKDIEPLFDKAVHAAIQQSQGSFIATFLQIGLSKKIHNVVPRIADALFQKKYAFSPAVVDAFIGTLMLTDTDADIMKVATDSKTIFLQSLLYVAQGDLKKLETMLSKDKSFAVPFMTAAATLVPFTMHGKGKSMHSYTVCVPWKKVLRSFFNRCFKQPVDEETRSIVASHLFAKYNADPHTWKKLSLWVCCAATQHMMVNQKKELSIESLQRSMQDFSRLFSRHLKEDLKTEGERLINGLYMAVYKKKVNKDIFNELLFNINDLVLLTSCKPEDLSHYLMAAKQFETIPLKPCAYDETADVIMVSLKDTLKKDGFIDRLKTIARSDTPAAARALRLLMHFDWCEKSDEEKEYAEMLYKIYKKEDTKNLFIEAEQCMIEKIHKMIFDHFDKNDATDDIIAELASLASTYAADPIRHALQVSKYACFYGKDEHALSRMLLSCVQARRLGVIIQNKEWRAYCTPKSREILWKQALICKEKSDDVCMQGYLDIIAYAVYLNKGKDAEEKMKLLGKGVSKHPMCSLLYAQHALAKVNNTFAGMPWDERIKCYHALQYAIMQGQRSLAGATSLDAVTQQEAMDIIEDNVQNSDLGSSITQASFYNDISIIGGHIASHPFKTVLNMLAFDVPIDNYIALAEDFKILPILKNAAQQNNKIAACALFRIYFTKLYDAVNSPDAEKQLGFIKQIMTYGCNYIAKDKSDHKELVKQYFMALINTMIKKQIDFAFFEELKNKIKKV